MNPIIKLLIKQIEDSAVMIERAAKASDKVDMHYDTKIAVNAAFDHFHSAVSAVKSIVGELL